MYKEPTKEQLQYRIKQLENVIKEIREYLVLMNVNEDDEGTSTKEAIINLLNIINKGIE